MQKHFFESVAVAVLFVRQLDKKCWDVVERGTEDGKPFVTVVPTAKMIWF